MPIFCFNCSDDIDYQHNKQSSCSFLQCLWCWSCCETQHITTGNVIPKPGHHIECTYDRLKTPAKQ